MTNTTHIRIPSIIRAALALAAAFILAATAATAPRLAAAAPAAATLANMQAAYNGETNAHARYLAFAKKADEEGYGEVASLFRATARAEEIHAANHAEVIKKMGATPAATLETPDVKSTRENLEAAIKGENYESTTMYPDFIKQAKTDRNKAAGKSLNYAMLTEQDHTVLYTQALAKLDSLKGSKATDYYVCSVCGETVRGKPTGKCSVCFSEKDKFEKVS